MERVLRVHQPIQFQHAVSADEANQAARVHRANSGGLLFPANVTFASVLGRIEREQLFTPVIGTIAMDQAAGNGPVGDGLVIEIQHAVFPPGQPGGLDGHADARDQHRQSAGMGDRASQAKAIVLFLLQTLAINRQAAPSPGVACYPGWRGRCPP